MLQLQAEAGRQLDRQLRLLPQGTAVCSLSITSAHAEQQAPTLLISRCHAGQAPILVQLPLPHDDGQCCSQASTGNDGSKVRMHQGALLGYGSIGKSLSEMGSNGRKQDNREADDCRLRQMAGRDACC